MSDLSASLSELNRQMVGALQTDTLSKLLYATDASVYQETPLAVAFPKNIADLKLLILFAATHKIGLIPRAAGTSLAGQCVGEGIVVDVSKHFTSILDFNAEEKWVMVEPGVVRDELNAFLKPHGYFFSPITSTANRAMIGGMVGNNSCGSTSIQYGTTRDHTLEVHTLLSDGSEAVFGPLTKEEFEEKRKGNTLEAKLYRQIHNVLSDKQITEAIETDFPCPNVHRRNMGYAADALLQTAVFSTEDNPFNFSAMLCGSEGTLAFTTKIKLHIDPLPLPVDVVLVPHFHTIKNSLLANQLVMKHQPAKCELMDEIILDCTKENLKYRESRFFIQGDPEAVLMIEFRGATLTEALIKSNKVASLLKESGLTYALPIVEPPRTDAVWELRKAGLGLLANIPGDKKAVTCIEDTAVDIMDLPDYIDEIAAMMTRYGQRAVYYAHVGAGELHLRPLLNLKDPDDVRRFYEISKETATLVKKYRGSLSGEHGDGRLRAAFLEEMVGPVNYQLFKDIKAAWDPNNIFNPGKIVDAPPMTSSLRYQPGQQTPQYDTAFDFSASGGILRAAEQCNGSGDCRKLSLSGGTMCPSYRATRNEKDTTRGRANTLRKFLTTETGSNPFAQEELKEVMDLCISCKGCTSECPSNVDMASMKAEFLYQYYKTNPVPLRARMIAGINRWNEWGSVLPYITNIFLGNNLMGKLLKKILDIHPERSLPKLSQQSLFKWYQKNKQNFIIKKPVKTVYLFCDEFTNFNDAKLGQMAIELLYTLNYQVRLIAHPESGRAAISKGLLDYAKKCANENTSLFADLITPDTPLLGIEPSAILSFRDEYPRLVDHEKRSTALKIKPDCLLIEEFIVREIQAGNITAERFTTRSRQLLLHGHCHQKALSDIQETVWALSLPENYHVTVIPSGCCGMAGSFGYEKEHYGISQQIGELVLFPAVRNADLETIIVANGTSCRHQITDGTGRTGQHLVEVLWEAVVV